MKLRHLFVALAAILLLAVSTLGPWYLGGRAEQAYRNGLSVIERQPGGLRVVDQIYERGWFSSLASVDLSPAEGDPADTLRLRINSRVAHGPRALADLTWPPTLAKVSSRLTLTHPAVQIEGVLAHTRVRWDGKTLTHLDLPSIDQAPRGDSPGVRAAPARGDLGFDPAARMSEAGLSFPSLEVLEENGAVLLTLRDLRAANRTAPWVPGLDISSGDLSVAELRAERPEGAVEARDLGISVKSRPEGGLLDVQVSYRAAMLRIAGADYAPAQVDLSLSRLDGATLSALQGDLADLAGKNLPEAMVGIASAALLMRHLPALAAANPGVALDRFDITTPSGSVTGRLALGVQGLTAADLDGQGTWLRRLVGDGELSLPRAVALDLLTQVQRQKALGEAEAAAPADFTPEQEQAMAAAAAAQVDVLVQEGWIAAEGERLRAVVRLADGLLTVNGKTIPIADPMPL
jgi:uncharacterized protein YdgA (DUF945 family)